MYSVKKISPAGHWVGITGIIIKQKKENLIEALHSYSLVCIAVFDAIIAAWDEKYRSNYIRLVTAIQHLISPEWQYLLQTPPFPEYPSGHSVISLQHFNSFIEAANEAAISRLCGDIHFRESLENGIRMGAYVGKKVVEKLVLK